jgi:hypothetical protein
VPALLDLSQDECERLLRRETYGRVVLATAGRIEIRSVNYTVRDDEILVRTAPDGLLARQADDTRMSFQIDWRDDARWQGWSVVARTRARVELHPEPGPPVLDDVRPWAAGDRSAELRLRWTSLTGRRTGAGWDLEAGLYSRRSAG